MLARANRRAGLKYAPAMSFAEAPVNTQVTVNQPYPGLEAPFDYGAPFNGDHTSIPNRKHARKARGSCDVRLYAFSGTSRGKSGRCAAVVFELGVYG